MSKAIITIDIIIDINETDLSTTFKILQLLLIKNQVQCKEEHDNPMTTIPKHHSK